MKSLVGPAGLAPAHFRLKGGCSAKLSYEPFAWHDDLGSIICQDLY